MNRVFVVGTFDGLHEGHMQLLKDAQKIGDVCLLVNSDKMIEERKGIKLIEGEDLRLSRCRDFLKYYEYSRIVDSLETIKYELIKNKAIVLHGDDYDIHSLSKLYRVDEGWWRMHGILPIFSPRQAGISSTELRKRK